MLLELLLLELLGVLKDELFLLDDLLIVLEFLELLEEGLLMLEFLLVGLLKLELLLVVLDLMAEFRDETKELRLLKLVALFL